MADEQPRDEAMKAYAAELAALRARLGLTLQEMADRLGVKVVTYKNWEDAHRMPSQAARSLIEQLAAGNIPAPVGRPKKKRKPGRPKGSKNKPKTPENQEEK